MSFYLYLLKKLSLLFRQLQKSIILENKFLEENFVMILKILSGDPDAILGKSSSWLEGLVALVYHKYPRCETSDVR
jgi:hypothetical protein